MIFCCRVRNKLEMLLMPCCWRFSTTLMLIDSIRLSVHSQNILISSSFFSVGQFIKCLVEARNELRHKSEIVQRSFKIKKALLYKVDRSSFDCLCQQLYKKFLVDHKQLVFFFCTSNATVHNLLQDQLNLSPACVNIRTHPSSVTMEQKAEPDESAELPDISFEESLADEKKDLFWLGRVY
ncbi:unnamed protein product [Musa acuminata var. zebrina]